MVPPSTDTDILSADVKTGDYDVVNDYFKSIADENNISYLNFNLLKAKCYDWDDSYFATGDHLSRKGAYEFSKVLGHILSEQSNVNLNAKSVINDYFFDSYDNYLNEMNRIICADVECSRNDINGVHMETYIFQNIEAENMFLGYDENKEEWSVVKRYSDDSVCDFSHYSQYRVCVKAKNSYADYDCYCQVGNHR